MDDQIFENLPLTKFDFCFENKRINLFREKMFAIEIEGGLNPSIKKFQTYFSPFFLFFC